MICFSLFLIFLIRKLNHIIEILYIKHLLVFLAPNIIFIGQMEKDIGRGVSRENVQIMPFRGSSYKMPKVKNYFFG